MVSEHWSMEQRLTFCMATMMLCYGIGCYIMVVDAMSLPVIGRHYPLEYLQKHPLFWKELNISSIRIHYPPWLREDKTRFWEWEMGDHFVSNIENAVMILSLFFGFMRTVDVIALFREKERMERWCDFWSLCENIK